MADKDQRVINLSSGQVSHGWVNKPSDGNAKVVVGYAPSMVRAFLVGESNAVVSRLYWYATDPDKAVKIVDSDDGGGFAVADSPIVADGRGFEIKSAALSGVTKIIWEAFGSENAGSVDPDDGEIYSMPATDEGTGDDTGNGDGTGGED